MIKKLIKYDIKKMTKILIYFYIATIVSSGITRFINIWNNIQAIAILGYVFSGITYSLIASTIVNTFVHILLRFYTNFYKDESYLTHTLPVSKNKLFLSKYISSIIVILASVVVCFASLFILFYSEFFIAGIKPFIEATVAGFNMSVGGFFTLIGLIIFSQICANISMCFMAIVKAHTYNSKRVLKGLIWFVVYYFVSIIVTLITAVIVFAIMGILPELTAEVLSQKAFITILIIGLVDYILYSIVFYFLCNKLFNKGVNVD